MYITLNMDNKKPFKFMHVWSKIQLCPKWKTWRLSAADKGEEGADVDETKMPGRSAERLIGKMCVTLNMDNKKPFNSMHVWSKIQECPKWKTWRLSSAGKGEEGADVDETKMPGRSAKRSIENKKAKTGKKVAGGMQEAMAV